MSHDENVECWELGVVGFVELTHLRTEVSVCGNLRPKGIALIF